MSSRSVYVSRGTSVDAVDAAVDACLASLGRSIETSVESADEYPGFDVAIDVYGADDATVIADARLIAAGIAARLPGRQVSLDLDLENLSQDTRNSA